MKLAFLELTSYLSIVLGKEGQTIYHFLEEQKTKFDHKNR